jgi:hypothetical protein
VNKPKTTGQLVQDLQKLVNTYCRNRDCVDGGAGCISCNRWYPYEDLQGGHFIPVGSSSIRFDERNINAQCRRCNHFLSGNQMHYQDGMRQKYGQEVVDYLRGQEGVTRQWKRFELLEMIEHYRGKLSGKNY